MKKYMFVLEIVFYVALPYLIWTNGREALGDYWAMLLSTVPGFIYTIVRFITERELNVTGVFILSSLFIGTIVDLLSGSAEKMLWNQLYLGLVFSGIYLVSLLIKKPLPLYFFVDIAYLQGYDRRASKKLFYRKEILKWFQWITVLFVVRGLTLAAMKAWMLNRYGVEAYTSLLIYRQLVGWAFGIFGLFLYMAVLKEIKRITKSTEETPVLSQNNA